MNLKISEHKSGLSGVALVAYEILGAKLHKNITNTATANAWAHSLDLAVTAQGELSGKEAVVAVDTAMREVAKAIQGNAVLQALDEAGAGGLAKVVAVDDGKEAVPTRVSKALANRYGSKFKLGAQIKSALATAENYRSRFVSALEAGVVLERGWTQRQLEDERVKAVDESLPEDVKAERDAKAEGVKNARAMGNAFTDAVLESDDADRRLTAELLTTIMVSFSSADTLLRESFLEAIGPWADKFDEARKAANAAAAESEEQSKTINLVDPGDAPVESDAIEAQAA